MPVHVAAKLAALEVLYPRKSRRQLVGDLLAAAIAEVEKKLPSYAGESLGPHPDTHEEIFEEAGPMAKCRTLAEQYYVDIENDMRNENPGKLFNAGIHAVGADKK